MEHVVVKTKIERFLLTAVVKPFTNKSFKHVKETIGEDVENFIVDT